jgi:hypothetical protein
LSKVIPNLRPQRNVVSFREITTHFDFTRSPVSAKRERIQHNRLASHDGILRNRPLQASLVIAGMRVKLPFSDRVLVVEVDVLMAVNVEIGGIVEHGSEIRCRNPLSRVLNNPCSVNPRNVSVARMCL